ncbi:hypothetical protein HYU95_01155 [Candidatus Daviesbacteria bacterium]|nr:hypothetical protein [Candidatus Daviesbacteria bacterium]
MTESVFGELRRVAKQRKDLQREALPFSPLEIEKPINPGLYKYFFDTQVAAEKQGAMDYRKYAARVWQDLVVAVEEQPQTFENDPAFRRFEANLILGLQDIDMRQHRYSELVDILGELVAKYGESVRKVAIWSTGDDSATGYQPAKIARSAIIGSFSKAIKTYDGEESKRFIAEKTAYIIADDKFKQLEEHLKSSGVAKIVVIEDNRGNLRKVAKIIDSLNVNRPEADKLEFMPVWATYSREGIEAREKAEAEETMAQYEDERNNLNAIDSPVDLLDDKFVKVFNGADVFIDFDGVIADNLTMRPEQARIKYSNLIGAIMEREKVNASEAEKIILDNLARIRI